MDDGGVERGNPVRRALGEIAAVVRADTDTHLHLRQRIVAIALISVAVDAICTVLIWLFERHARAPTSRASAARCSSGRRSC